MNLQKLNPWNWFSHEDQAANDSHHIPVTAAESAVLTPLICKPLVDFNANHSSSIV